MAASPETRRRRMLDGVADIVERMQQSSLDDQRFVECVARTPVRSFGQKVLRRKWVGRGDAGRWQSSSRSAPTRSGAQSALADRPPSGALRTNNFQLLDLFLFFLLYMFLFV